MRRKIVGATYPLMMIGIGFIVVTILMAKVSPRSPGCSSIRTRRSRLHALLVTLSDAFKAYWWLMFLSIALVSFVFERIYNKGGEGPEIDRFILVPVLGDLMRKAGVPLHRTLSTLLGGVPAMQSLEITETVVGNRVSPTPPSASASAWSRARTSPRP